MISKKQNKKKLWTSCSFLRKLEIENTRGNCGALKYIEESFIMASVWHLVYCIVLLMGSI